MSVFDDTRKLIQDFLAPELREISVRLDSLEEKMGLRFSAIDDRFKALETRVDDRFKGMEWRMASAEQQATEHHNQVMQAISRLADVYELKERVARIEAREKIS